MRLVVLFVVNVYGSMGENRTKVGYEKFPRKRRDFSKDEKIYFLRGDS